MVPYDGGNKFSGNFSILPQCDARGRSLLIGDRLENCKLPTSNFKNFVLYHEVTITTIFIEGVCESTYTWVKRSMEKGRTGLKGVVLYCNTLALAHFWHVLVILTMSFLMSVQTNLSPKSLTQF